MRSYGAARSLFSIVSVMAWIMLIGGVILFFAGGNAGASWAQWNRAPEELGVILGVIPGTLITIIGFFSLVTAQMGRAGVDSAEYGQQMLQIARDHLDISRQTLNKGDTARQCFAALPETTGPRATASYADTPQPVSTTTPQLTTEARIIAYKGKEIAAIGSAFHVAGLSFDTLKEAQAHIDKLVPMAALQTTHQS